MNREELIELMESGEQMVSEWNLTVAMLIELQPERLEQLDHVMIQKGPCKGYVALVPKNLEWWWKVESRKEG